MANLYAIVVLVALLSEFAISVVTDLLNLRSMRPDLPAPFRDVHDEESYRRSQDYTRVRTRFALWPRSLNLVVLLAFWFGGGFEWLDQSLRALSLSPLLTGLLFFAVLLVAQGVVNLPFRLYSTFVIEERFGFNRTTKATFVRDLLMGIALGGVLGGAFAALLLTLFEHAGHSAWLYCWGAAIALTLLVQFIAPTWIMPLFNKFTPLEENELRERIMAYARSVSFPLQNLFVIDGSRRSSKANAFFTGFGKNRRIGLYDTLIERHTPEELVAIVAHEIGHYKKRHVITGMLVSFAHFGVLFFAFGYFMRQDALFEAFGVSQPSVYVGLLLSSLLYQPAEMLLSLLMLSHSRKNEFEADRFAVETSGLGDALISGLKRLSKDSLSNLTPHPGYVLFHYTHPPLLQRIAAIERASGG